MSSFSMSRRSLLRAAAAASVASSLPLAAAPQTRRRAIALVVTRGGLNALHATPDTLLGHFGTTPDSMLPTGTGLFVDKATLGAFPAVALSHMAVVGVDHGITAHAAAETAMFTGSLSYPLALAAAMSSEAALRCALVGNAPAFTTFAPVPGASLTAVKDVRTAIDLLVGSTRVDDPSRRAMAKGLRLSYALSRKTIEQNPRTLASHASGYDTIIGALERPTRPIDWADIAMGYGFSPMTTDVASNASRFAAAELAIRGGTPVVIIPVNPTPQCGEAGWDTHGDVSGACARSMFSQVVTPHLAKFLERTFAMTDCDVTTAIFGEFSRDPYLSDHARCLAAAVFGPHVKPGSTGRALVRDNGKLVMPEGTPGIAQFWSLLAALGGSGTQPFGANPHQLVAG